MSQDKTQVRVEAYIRDDDPSTLHVVALSDPPSRVRLSTLGKNTRLDCELVPAKPPKRPAHAMRIDYDRKGRPMAHIDHCETRICSSCMEPIPFALYAKGRPARAASFCPACGSPLTGQPPAPRARVM